MATHPLPPDAEQGRRPGSSAAANPAAPGLGAAGTEGKRERGLRGIDPLPHLELGWRAEAARRKRAVVGRAVRSGGAAAAREEAGGGCDGLGWGGATPRAFYRRARSVRRSG